MKISYNKYMKSGRKLSEEHKRKISEAHKGIKFSEKRRNSLKVPHKGSGVYERTEANKIALSLAKLGQKYPNRKSPPPMKEETRIKIGLKHKGNKYALGKNVGNKHHNWKGGVTPINKMIRSSPEYKLWRMAVFARDNYTCVWGGKEHGNKLHADHIKPFSLFPELRFAIDNGRTLCKECHRKTDTWGNRTKNNQ